MSADMWVSLAPVGLIALGALFLLLVLRRSDRPRAARPERRTTSDDPAGR